MLLLVGLGNPDEEYAKTRHNFGFQVADAIRQHYPFTEEQRKFSGLVAGGEILSAKVVLLKPTTYMNDSGLAVAKAQKYFKIPLENVLVFHDEADLFLGHIKVKTGGSAAGHNGIKSIDQAIGNNYTRIRLGIKPTPVEGRPEINYKTPEFVLGKFSREEQAIVDRVVEGIVQSLPLLFSQEYTNFCNRINNLA